MRQGDVVWLDLGKPAGSGPGYRHPHVVVQNNLFNASRLRTAPVCALTSNLERASVPGNVMLRKGEAGLPKRSVVLVSQVFTVGKERLNERIGALPPGRVREILDGIQIS